MAQIQQSWTSFSHFLIKRHKGAESRVAGIFFIGNTPTGCSFLPDERHFLMMLAIMLTARYRSSGDLMEEDRRYAPLFHDQQSFCSSMGYDFDFTRPHTLVMFHHRLSIQGTL